MLKLIEGLTRLSGYDVVIMDKLREKYPERFNKAGGMDYNWFESTVRPFNHIYIRYDVNSISFTLKTENKDGCDLKAMIAAVVELVYANEKAYEAFNEEMKKKLTDKSKQVTNNLLFAFKHLKELERLRTVSEDLKKENAV